MSELKTSYQWTVINNKQDFKIGQIAMGIAGLTPADTWTSETFTTLTSLSQVNEGDKIYLTNSGGSNNTTVFGYNSLDVGTPLIGACIKPVTIGIDENKYAFTLAYEQNGPAQSSTDWLKCSGPGLTTTHLFTGAEVGSYNAGNVIYVMLVTDEDRSQIRPLIYMKNVLDTSQSAGSGSYGYVQAYVFGEALPTNLYNALIAVCFDSDRENNYVADTTATEYIYSLFGNFRVQGMGVGQRSLSDGAVYSYRTDHTVNDIRMSTSFYVQNSEGTIKQGYSWGGVQADVRENNFNEYATRYHNYFYSSNGWTLGTNLICDKENGKYVTGLAPLSKILIGDQTYQLSGGKIEYHGASSGSYLKFWKGNTLEQTINLWKIVTSIDTSGSTWYTYGAFICKVDGIYKVYLVGQNSNTEMCSLTIQLNADLQDLLKKNVTIETIEYTTPEQDAIDDTQKARRGEDENGSYTETYDPVTKTWTKTYDYDRTKTGTRGQADGTGDIDNGDTRITSPKSSTSITATGGMYKVFVPTALELKSFADDLHDASVLNVIKEYFSSNPMDGIMGLSMIPYYKAPDGTDYPTIGTWSSTNAMSYAATDVIEFSYGNLTLPEAFGNYLDYKGTRLSIFLPHIGFKDIDPEYCMGCNLSLAYIIFRATGDILAYLYSGTHLVYQWQGNCAMQIPVTHTDYSTAVSSAINMAGIAAGTFMGNPLETGATNFSAERGLSSLNGVAGMNHPQMLTAGNISGTSGFYSARQAFITVSRPMVLVDNANQYAHDCGYPSCETVNIRTLKGFTKFANIDISAVSALDEEKDELRTIMTGEGFYV